MIWPQILTNFLGLFLPVIHNSLIPTYMSVSSNMEKQTYSLRARSLELPSSEEINQFDFIIVGGGTAGCILANRISEHFTVLLLERGGQPNLVTEVPANTFTLMNNPNVDYTFKTVPQKNACLSNYNQQCSLSTGVALGGSSNIDWQQYLRGSPLDYENWANITGDDGWSYLNVLPFLTKSEKYCTKCENSKNDPTFNPYYHNKNGLLSVGKSSINPLVEEFLQASEWSGIPRVDLNAPYMEGAAPSVLTQKNGRRSSTKTAFIDPIQQRPTLKIKKFAKAYKILFRDTVTKEAFGVVFDHFDKENIAYATKEIIISAGAIETSKLLMLSGIGPREHLESLGIPTLLDAPVGKNLQDHVGTFVGPFLIDQPKSILLERDLTIWEVFRYFNQGTGILSQPGIHATSLFSSSVAKAEGDGLLWPDTQFMLSAMGITTMMNEITSTSFNTRIDIVKQIYDPVVGADAFHILVFNKRPESRGEIKLASSDYRVDPWIDPKYFQDVKQRDLKVLLEGVTKAASVFETAPSFRALGSKLSAIPFPSCQMFTFRSDEYWDCYIRHFTISSFHYCGTAAMGKTDSINAVVDSNLSVIGTKNLRVIDASVMPDIVSADTNGPTMMIAEKGAQLILDKHLRNIISSI